MMTASGTAVGLGECCCGKCEATLHRGLHVTERAEACAHTGNHMNEAGTGLKNV